MRWFRHMSASWQDEKLAELIEKKGLQGYGFWWRLLEILAEQMTAEHGPNLSYTAQTWATKFGLRSDSVCSLFAVCAQSGLILINYSGTKIEVSVPNLVKYKDEYSKKSGHSPDKVRSDSGPSRARVSETETEEHTEAEEQPPKPSLPDGKGAAASGELFPVNGNGRGPGKAELTRWFEGEFWPVVWAKIGKDAALNVWLLKVHSREEAEGIIAAAIRDGPDIMGAALARAAREGGPPRPLHPRTWLNQGRWQDEALPVITEVTRLPTKGEVKQAAFDRAFQDAVRYERERGRI